MKRALIILVVLIAVLGAALPFAPVDFLKAPIERALERGLGRRAEVDGVHLTLFSGPGFSLDGVTIHEDPRAGIEPFAYATTLDARLDLLALLRGRLAFSSLNFNDATFNLVKPDNQPWNFQMLLGAASSASPAASSGAPSGTPAAVAATLDLPALKMRGGRVNFKFGQTKSVLYFDDTDLTVFPGGRGSMDLRFSGVPARTDRSAQNFGHFFVSGTVAPSASGEQLNLQAELEPSALDALSRLFTDGAFDLKGVVALSAQISGPPSRLNVNGSVQFSGAGKASIDYQGSLDLPGQTLELDSKTAEGAQPAAVPAAFHVSVRTFLSAPQWDVTANFMDAPLSAAIDAARQIGVPVPDKALADGTIAGSMRYGNAEGFAGNVELRDASITLPDAAPMKAATATVFFKGNTILAGPVTVTFGAKESAELGATYQFGEGGGTEIRMTTRGMSMADLRSLGVTGAPLFDRVSDGTVRGSVRYQKPVSADGEWSGDFEVQNATLAVEGMADPVRVQSAAVSVRAEQVAVTRIKAKVGHIAFTADYRWDMQGASPHKFRIQADTIDAKDVEALFKPTMAREAGLLARTLRLRGASTPEWLTGRKAEGTLAIESLTAGDNTITGAAGRVVWDGVSIKISNIEGKISEAALSGEVRVDLSGRTPRYRWEGKIEDVPYKGGNLTFTGKAEAAGSGAALLASVKAEGTFRGRSIAFSPEAEFRRVSGRFTMSASAAGPQWKLSALELMQGSEMYTGDGATQPDGKLVLNLASAAGRQVRYTGSLVALVPQP